MPTLPPHERRLGAALGMFVGHTLGHALQHKHLTLPQLAQSATSQNGTSLPPGETHVDTTFQHALLGFLQQDQEASPTSLAELLLSTYGEYSQQAGSQTNAVLSRLAQGMPPQVAAFQVWEQSQHQAAGSGGLKRALPAALTFLENSKALEHHTLLICQLTHPDPRCIDASLFLNRLLRAIILEKWTQPSHTTRYLVGLGSTTEQAVRIAQSIPFASLSTNGYAITSLQSAYRFLTGTNNFSEGLLALFEIGEKLATIGAITGALLGARWGPDAIPPPWLQTLPQTLLNPLP